MPIDLGWFAAGGVCAASGIFAWGAVAPSSQIFGPTVRRLGDASSIALTFDDGPNPSITPELLDLLDRYQAKASFFLIGRNIRAFPGLVKEIVDRGHTIGNHTETHAALTFLSARSITEEIALCDEAIFEVTGKKSRLMRPPYGYRSPLLDGIIRRSGGGRVVMWSATARDWKAQLAARVIKHLRGIRGGDIVLLHDGDHRLLNGAATYAGSVGVLAAAVERCRLARRKLRRDLGGHGRARWMKKGTTTRRKKPSR
jgi:peptidoglycan/xylan/chitin deacetylase (PgdA/CDA1 family)